MTRYLFGAGVGLACVVAIYTAGQHQARQACAAARDAAFRQAIEDYNDAADIPIDDDDVDCVLLQLAGGNCGGL
jgi:hypothetical protein